jgi:hypothetical protein
VEYNRRRLTLAITWPRGVLERDIYQLEAAQVHGIVRFHNIR